MGDSKKVNLSVREIRARALLWSNKYRAFEDCLEKELKIWLEERNGDLPTTYDLKLKIFPQMPFSNSYSSVMLSTFFYFCSQGFHPKFKIVQGAFIAPK